MFQREATGTISALNGAVELEWPERMDGADGRVISFNGGVGVKIAGTFVGTFVAEVSRDGVTWATKVLYRDSDDTAVSSVTDARELYANAVGLKRFRIRCSAYTSGTATVTLIARAG